MTFRELSPSEIAQVGGGQDEEEVDEIVVTGRRIEYRNTYYSSSHIYTINPDNWNSIYSGDYRPGRGGTPQRPANEITVEAFPTVVGGEVVWHRVYRERHVV